MLRYFSNGHICKNYKPIKRNIDAYLKLIPADITFLFFNSK